MRTEDGDWRLRTEDRIVIANFPKISTCKFFFNFEDNILIQDKQQVVQPCTHSSMKDNPD